MSYQKILANQASLGHFGCLGLDIDASKMPLFLRGKTKKMALKGMYCFLTNIIDETGDIVQSYKLNLAFYEQWGTQGWELLERIVVYIKDSAPTVFIIGDGKRGDIDNTNLAYMKALEQFDAFTIAPYLGGEANNPFFFDEAGMLRDKLVFVLCLTSNKGAGEFQDLWTLDFNPADKPDNVSYESWFKKIEQAYKDAEILQLYQKVAKNAIAWSPNVGFVTGATYTENMKVVRKIIGNDKHLLIPGIGEQGGGIEQALAAGMNNKGEGVTINVSRAALYASQEENYAEACRQYMINLNTRINAFRRLHWNLN